MKNVKIYTKNGNEVLVSEDLVEHYLKNGYFKKDPTKKKEQKIETKDK